MGEANYNNAYLVSSVMSAGPDEPVDCRDTGDCGVCEGFASSSKCRDWVDMEA